jgi:sialate O-acetylesterase
VQLATFRPDTLDNGFSVIRSLRDLHRAKPSRWHQTADVGYVPNDRLVKVFMASPLDTYDNKEGYPGGLHPRNKQIVGQRLAMAGLNVAYGEESYRPYGPVPTTVELDVSAKMALVHYDYR